MTAALAGLARSQPRNASDKPGGSIKLPPSCFPISRHSNHGLLYFCQTQNDQLKEPMFFGQSVSVARYDQQKHDIFERLIEKQLSFFWRPEEVDVSHDRIDFQALPPHEAAHLHLQPEVPDPAGFHSGPQPHRGPAALVSHPGAGRPGSRPGAFSETHPLSLLHPHHPQHVVNNPGQVFDDIVTNEQISKRAGSISHFYDDLIGGHLRLSPAR